MMKIYKNAGTAIGPSQKNPQAAHQQRQTKPELAGPKLLAGVLG
jgi:hypothetical protein